MIGVGVTVLGLHGMKVSNVGRVESCTKPLVWALYLFAWFVGQIIQLLAVGLAPEPVVGAVSNFAIVVNACLASRLLGERVTRTDVIAALWMIFGACIVVGFTPPPQQRSLSLSQLNHLFSTSALALGGLAITTLLALVALPSAMSSSKSQQPSYSTATTAAAAATFASASAPAAGTARTAAAATAATIPSPMGGVAFGILAGYTGGTSITMTKLCWLVFDHYSWAALAMGEPWALSVVAFGGEILMAVTLFNGMARHEASVVVPTYYISLTLCSSLQGLCVFQLLPEMRARDAFGFTSGVLLCVLAVGWSGWRRNQLQLRGAGQSRGGGGGYVGGAEAWGRDRSSIDASRLLEEAQAAQWGVEPYGSGGGDGRAGGGGGEGDNSQCSGQDTMRPVEGHGVAPARAVGPSSALPNLA